MGHLPSSFTIPTLSQPDRQTLHTTSVKSFKAPITDEEINEDVLHIGHWDTIRKAR